VAEVLKLLTERNTRVSLSVYDKLYLNGRIIGVKNALLNLKEVMVPFLSTSMVH